VNIDNRYSSALAIVSGVMITITRLLVPQFYPSQATNGWTTVFYDIATTQFKPFAFLGTALWFLVDFGGVSILVGGALCYRNHLRTGKELVGIGATFGFADLLLALPSITNGSSGPVYLEAVAWMGLLFAVLANRHIKGPRRSYAGELQWFMSGLGRKVSGEDRKRRERRLRRKRSLSLTK
jgi:hypothetical protein